VVDEATVSLRLQTVRAGVAMLADNPLFGVGLGCSVLGWPLYAPPESDAEHWLHSHNTVVQVFAETGIVGGTMFLLLLSTTIYGAAVQARRWRKRNRSDLQRLVAAPVISLVGFFVCGLTGGYLLSWFPYLILGLATAARTLPEPVAAAARQPAAPLAAHSRARVVAHPIPRRAARAAR
jgi:O-antigen ligase